MASTIPQSDHGLADARKAFERGEDDRALHLARRAARAARLLETSMEIQDTFDDGKTWQTWFFLSLDRP